MTRTKLRNCPVCGWKTLPILYGYPTKDMFDRDDIVLGGCLIDPMNPDRSCTNCDWRGQEWSILAPNLYRVWIIQDPGGIYAPVGFVTERYDAVLEKFFLGDWEDPSDSKAYKAWLRKVGEPKISWALSSDLGIEKLGDLRAGTIPTSDEELAEWGFELFEHAPPNFRFEGPMWPPSQAD